MLLLAFKITRTVVQTIGFRLAGIIVPRLAPEHSPHVSAVSGIRVPPRQRCPRQMSAGHSGRNDRTAPRTARLGAHDARLEHKARLGRPRAVGDADLAARKS